MTHDQPHGLALGAGGASIPSAVPELPKLVSRNPQTIRLHPAYAALRLPAHVVAPEDSHAGRAAGSPIVVTTSGIVIDGLDRWRSSLDSGENSIACLEYDVTECVALEMIIRASLRRSHLNAFCRTELALRLEATGSDGVSAFWLDSALSSNLTKSARTDRRRDLAALAGVSTGNVTKVKQILETAVPEVVRALRQNSISINRAWQWRLLSARRQRDALTARQQRRSVDDTLRHLIRRQQGSPKGSTAVLKPLERVRILEGISGGVPEPTVLTVSDEPGMVLVVSRGLRDWLNSRDSTA